MQAIPWKSADRDGLICVENVIRNHLTTKKVNGAATDAVIEWADF